jgi:hypothetical protein
MYTAFLSAPLITDLDGETWHVLLDPDLELEDTEEHDHGGVRVGCDGFGQVRHLMVSRRALQELRAGYDPQDPVSIDLDTPDGPGTGSSLTEFVLSLDLP